MVVKLKIIIIFVLSIAINNAKSENTHLKYSSVQRCTTPSVYSVVGGDRPSLAGLCSFMRRRLTEDEFILRAREIHGNKYDYSNCGFVRLNDIRITITCDRHGPFKQEPSNHLWGRAGCPSCKNSKTTEQFITEITGIHGDKYCYDKLIYLGTRKRVLIKCSKHGYFSQWPEVHLEGGGCLRCYVENNKGAYASKCKYFPDLLLNIYFFRCYNKREDFYKIGLAKNVKARAWDLPYRIEMINSLSGKIKDLFPLEQECHSILRSLNLQYIPNFKFGGCSECFNLPENGIEGLKKYECFSGLLWK